MRRLTHLRSGREHRFRPAPGYQPSAVTADGAAANSSSGSRPCCIANRLGSRPSGGADLGVDVLDVVGDRLRRDHELLGDLLVREPAGEQPQHLDLALGQPGGAFAAARDAVAGGAEHRLDDVARRGARP